MVLSFLIVIYSQHRTSCLPRHETACHPTPVPRESPDPKTDDIHCISTESLCSCRWQNLDCTRKWRAPIWRRMVIFTYWGWQGGPFYDNGSETWDRWTVSVRYKKFLQLLLLPLLVVILTSTQGTKQSHLTWTLMFFMVQNSANRPVSHSARHQRPARERHIMRIASRENVDNQAPRNTNFTQ